MKKLIFAITLGGLAIGAGANASDRSEKMAAEADAKLAQFEQTGEMSSCLSLRSIDHIKPLDENRFLVEVGYKNYYLTETSGSCHNATRPNHRIQYSTTSSSLCQNDIIQIIDGSTGFHAGSCSLGSFERLEKKSDNGK